MNSLLESTFGLILGVGCAALFFYACYVILVNLSHWKAWAYGVMIPFYLVMGFLGYAFFGWGGAIIFAGIPLLCAKPVFRGFMYE